MELSNTHATNVGSTERLISIGAGGLLLLNAITAKRFSLLKLAAGGYLMYRGVTGNCGLYTLSGKASTIPSENINIRLKMFVAKSPDSCYRVWRNFENIPLFMPHIKDVKVVYENISEWKAKLEGNPVELTWRSVVVRDVPGEEISWKSLPDSMVDNVGKIEFRPSHDAEGTDVHVTISYKPPFGLVGDAVSSFFKPSLEKVVREDVFNFKQFIESNINY